MDRRNLLQLAAVAAPGSALAQISTTPDWKPEFFDAHQNETVIALSELIIPATDTPGAKAALVNRWMDRMLGAGAPEQRDAFLSGLGWLDGLSIDRHSKPFVRLTEADQVAILKSLDGGTGPGAQFFRMAKGMTSRIYYSTEIGMRELNKGGRVPATFACTT
ncbi:MAG: gluconate 2-dehydrogenase subunit 3 family protein [Bryobacteraceae bacterium]